MFVFFREHFFFYSESKWCTDTQLAWSNTSVNIFSHLCTVCRMHPCRWKLLMKLSLTSCGCTAFCPAMFVCPSHTVVWVTQNYSPTSSHLITGHDGQLEAGTDSRMQQVQLFGFIKSIQISGWLLCATQLAASALVVSANHGFSVT